LIGAFEAGFVFTQLRSLRDIHVAVKALEHLSLPISATRIGTMLAQ
jgi:hypothetical protein